MHHHTLQMLFHFRAIVGIAIDFPFQFFDLLPDISFEQIKRRALRQNRLSTNIVRCCSVREAVCHSSWPSNPITLAAINALVSSSSSLRICSQNA